MADQESHFHREENRLCHWIAGRCDGVFYVVGLGSYEYAGARITFTCFESKTLSRRLKA